MRRPTKEASDLPSHYTYENYEEFLNCIDRFYMVQRVPPRKQVGGVLDGRDKYVTEGNLEVVQFDESGSQNEVGIHRFHERQKIS